MKKSILSMLAVALAVFAVMSPAVASGSNASGGMGNRFGMEASRLAAPPIVMVEAGGRMELATVARISRDVTALALPSGRVLLHVEPRFGVKPAAFQDPGAPPPTGWQGMVFYDVRAKETAVVASYPISSFRDFLHRGWRAELNGFAGMETTSKTPVAGVAFMFPFKVSGDGKFTAALGIALTGHLGGDISGGPAASASLKF